MRSTAQWKFNHRVQLRFRDNASSLLKVQDDRIELTKLFRRLVLHNDSHKH